ncbi:Speckle-type POZ protein [Araneus ventricosus]|uniref:Speckle-type POZ protein n=1 Tax=Araneus ventricosus TaxID=182803 RepID=A0A4Y2L3G7_ARAVE|nr:Speckle-type POZ protein [Araneus ventricosus]
MRSFAFEAPLSMAGCPDFTFVWRIKNFSFCNQMKDKNLDSPKFTAHCMKNTEWFLRIYPRGRMFDCYIPCFLRRTDSSDGPQSVEIDYILTVISADGSIVFLREITGHSFERGSGFGFPDFVRRDDIFENQSLCLPEDTLTIKCQMWMYDNDAATSTYCSGCTRIGFDTRCYTWTIKEFTVRSWIQKLTIPLMTASGSPPDRSISFLLNVSDDYLHIFISNNNNRDGEGQFMKCGITVLDSEGYPRDSKKDEHLFVPHEKEWEFPLFIKKFKLTRNSEIYLPNDMLTLRCSFHISVGIESERIEEFMYGLTPSHQKHTINENIKRVQCKNLYSLRNDIHRLYVQQKFCDLALKTQNTNILVHKAVVCSRSPVISDMVENDSAVKRTGTLDLSDIDSKTLNRMITFMYSDNFEYMTPKSAEHLYLAAEKYQIYTLKELCSTVIVANLSVENVCDILAFAEQHKDATMKMASQEFICENSAEIFVSGKWQRFMIEWIELAGEIMHYVCLKKS